MRETEFAFSSPRTKGVFAILVVMGWSFVASYAIHAGMRPNPIKLPLENVDVVRAILPEGWRFFTKNAEEDNIFVYARVRDEWVPAIEESPTSMHFLLGANRTGRYRGVEMGLITAALGKNAWTSCSGDPMRCLSELPLASIGPVSDRPTLCRELGLVQQPPVPWAWARSQRPVVMPSKVARVVVSC
jgi:antimicrobial peptide system SdpA family protein